MNPHSFDLRHIFWGDTSWILIAGIAFRVVVMFVYALILLRFISRRGFGSLSLFEIIIIVVLGSAVGDPTLNPDVPLVRGFIVITVVILAMRATVYFVSLNRKATDIYCRAVWRRFLQPFPKSGLARNGIMLQRCLHSLYQQAVGGREHSTVAVQQISQAILGHIIKRPCKRAAASLLQSELP